MFPNCPQLQLPSLGCMFRRTQISRCMILRKQPMVLDMLMTLTSFKLLGGSRWLFQILQHQLVLEKAQATSAVVKTPGAHESASFDMQSLYSIYTYIYNIYITIYILYILYIYRFCGNVPWKHRSSQ